MSPLQFDEWYADTCRKFPAIRGWLIQMGDVAAGELMAEWCEVLSVCDLQDLLVANKRMLAGEDEGPGQFQSQWQEIPAKVRRLALMAKYRREEVESGRASPDLSGPKVHCKHCQDTGRLFVAHPALIAAILNGAVRCKWLIATVRCNRCDRGRARGKLASELSPGDDARKAERQAAYNPELHFLIPQDWPNFDCLFHPEFSDPQNLIDLRAWVLERKATWDGKKRHSEFDDYNRRNEVEQQEFV